MSYYDEQNADSPPPSSKRSRQGAPRREPKRSNPNFSNIDDFFATNHHDGLGPPGSGSQPAGIPVYQPRQTSDYQ